MPCAFREAGPVKCLSYGALSPTPLVRSAGLALRVQLLTYAGGVLSSVVATALFQSDSSSLEKPAEGHSQTLLLSIVIPTPSKAKIKLSVSQMPALYYFQGHICCRIYFY